MRKGFTLIELVVAVALLSMVLSFAGVIFNVSIESHRTAKANAEIMRNLRAITDQLNTDFAGIQTDAPLLIWFEKDDPNRYDQIMFFANGDFQSIQLYTESNGNAVPDADDGEWVLKGNAARIHYGQARIWSGIDSGEPDEQGPILARRQHILTADPCVSDWPDEDMSDFGLGIINEWYEHDRLSLSEWKAVEATRYDTIAWVCFDNRPFINMDAPEETFHKLMCEGVGSFAIQWAYWDDDEERFLWFPSEDPDGDGDEDDSHFEFMRDEFGVYFNVLNGSRFITSGSRVWYPIGDTDIEYDSTESFESSFYPKALKFTFRLYDSKGIIKKDGERGREFTHIVYLGG